MMNGNGQVTRREAEAGQELVDAMVSAVDVDRSEALERLRRALEPFGLDAVFGDEVRLSGVPSLTWGRCEFCSDMIGSLDIAEEVAA